MAEVEAVEPTPPTPNHNFNFTKSTTTSHPPLPMQQQPIQFIHWTPPQEDRHATDGNAECSIQPQSRRTRADRKVRLKTHTHGLQRLPYDVLLLIFSILNIDDVLTMLMVSHLFYDVSNTPMIWMRLAHEFLLRARPLHLADFQDPAHLPFQELKRAVLSVHFLEQNWSLSEPKYVSSPSSVNLDMMQLDCFCYAMSFASRYLLLPTKEGFLVGWDIVRNVCVGRFGMNSGIGHRSILINVRAEYKERSLYCIVGKSMPLHHNEMRFSVLHIKFPEDPRPNPEGQRSQSNSEPHQLQFNILTRFTMPRCRIIELHILDTKKRIIGILFLCHDTNTIGLYMIFDWDSGLTAITNTELPFKYRRTVISLRLSPCGEQVTAHSELDGNEQYRTYSLAALRESSVTGTWRPMLASTYPMLRFAEVPSGSGTFNWTSGSAEMDKRLSGSLPLRVWTLRQWWPGIGKIPERSSRIILYMKSGAEGPKWKIAQYYSTLKGPLESNCHCRTKVAAVEESQDIAVESETQIQGHALTTSTATSPSPSSSSSSSISMSPPTPTVCRFTADITNPRLMPQGHPALPLVAISFNHVGWVELVPNSTSSNTGSPNTRARNAKKTVFRMITFPDPDTCPCQGQDISGAQNVSSESQVRTLDIPNTVLSKACHLIIDPTTGSVLVTTTTNELHTYRYV